MPTGVARLVAGGEHDGPGPVAEQDAGGSVGVVQEAGQELRADDQRVPGHAGRDVGAGRRVGVHEARAGRCDVERGCPGVADRLLHQGRGRGHPVVRRQRRQDDQVDVVGNEPRGVDRAQCRDRRHRRGGLVRRGHMPLADPGAADDPLVVGVDHALEVRVGQDLGRGIAAPAGEPDGVGRGGRGGRHAGSTSISGCLALTSAPLSEQMRTTRPARSLLISLNSFMASIRPMIWPTDTWSPTAT